jgi:hypothetical protein
MAYSPKFRKDNPSLLLAGDANALVQVRIFEKKKAKHDHQRSKNPNDLLDVQFEQ